MWPTSADIRRGAVIALYGLALTLFAVILSARSATSVAIGTSNPYSLVFQTTRGWLLTPIGLFEAFAYIGLGIVVLGVARYWVANPLLRRVGPSDQPGSTEFEFQTGDPNGHQGGEERVGHNSDLVSLLDPGAPQAESPSRRGLVDTRLIELAENDFLRSPDREESISNDATDRDGGESVLAQIRYSDPRPTDQDKALISDGAVEASFRSSNMNDGNAIKEALGLDTEDVSAGQSGERGDNDGPRESVSAVNTAGTEGSPESSSGSRESNPNESEVAPRASNQSGVPPIRAAISSIRDQEDDLVQDLQEEFDFESSHVNNAIRTISAGQEKQDTPIASLQDL